MSGGSRSPTRSRGFGRARSSSSKSRPAPASEERPTMFEIGLSPYLVLASLLFTLGIFGIFLNRRNVIIILLSIELMLLSVNINFVAFSSFLHNMTGQVFAMFVLTVAAAEAAIGLAILVVYFRNRGTIAVEDIHLMKG